MNAKVKMSRIKCLPLVVVIMSVCMLGSRPVNSAASKSNLPEDVKCATTLTANNPEMRIIAQEHPDIIIKAATVKMARF